MGAMRRYLGRILALLLLAGVGGAGITACVVRTGPAHRHQRIEHRKNARKNAKKHRKQHRKAAKKHHKRHH